MPYYATGVDRDSYVTGVRPGASKWGAVHDVNARRDNLPDNVFSYIRDGVQREERLRLTEAERQATTRMQIAKGGRGKKMAPNHLAAGAGGEASRAMEDMARLAETNDRHDALVELYALERQQWAEMLSARGLAMTRV